MRTEVYEGFIACALKGSGQGDLGDAQALIEQINRRATQARASYAVHLRERCLPTLGQLAVRLRSMEVPPDLRGGMRELASSVDEQSSAWEDYAAFLATLEDRYDPGTVAGPLERIAHGWEDFLIRHRRLGSTARTKGEAGRRF